MIDRLRVGDSARIGFDWTDYAPPGAAVSAVAWSAEPATAANATRSQIEGMQTTVLVDAVEAGPLRVTGTVTFTDADSSTASQDYLVLITGGAAGSAYLSASDAVLRLLGFGIEAEVEPVDVVAATLELDAMRPFIGDRYGGDAQSLAFPRTVEPDGSSGGGVVPEPVLDAVSLLALAYAEDEGPPLKSEGIMSANVTYSSPKRSVNRRRVDALLWSYLKTRGRSPGAGLVNPADPFGR